jgi:hypothetical protein
MRRWMGLVDETKPQRNLVELFLTVALTVSDGTDRLGIGVFLTAQKPCETLPLIAVDNRRPVAIRLVLPLRNSIPLRLVPGLTDLEDISFRDFFHLFRLFH